MKPILKQSSKELYIKTTNLLLQSHSEGEARQISRILIEDYFNITFARILVNEELMVSDDDMILFQEMTDRVVNHEPVQYVLGRAHFYGRNFIVDPSTLIPRPETEELVDLVIKYTKKDNPRILDIGTGSGCIAISLAAEIKGAEVSAIDVSSEALKIASTNAKEQRVNINFLETDILSLDQLPKKYDVIVSNPPYVTEVEKQLMQRNVLDHEPHEALFVPDDDPLVFYRKIISLAKEGLYEKGQIFFEINESYGYDLIRLAEASNCSVINLLKDIHGKNRMLRIMFS